MAITYNFATQAELRAVGPQKVARAMQERLGFRLMPMQDVNAPFVEWEQPDNDYGLQQLRGLGGSVPLVQRVGKNRYRIEPGYYGEQLTIDEAELTLSAGLVGEGFVPMKDRSLSLQDKLINRELDRIEYIIWQVLSAGTFSVSSKTGVVHGDTFSTQTHDASTWGTAASSTPLLDFRTVASTKGLGFGVNFGARAMAVMNGVTARYLLSNSNAADLGGKFVNGGSTVNSLADVNIIQLANDLPKIAIYDEGYYDDSNTFQYYVPTNKVIVVGARNNGEPVAAYFKTRHSLAGGGVGSWEYVKDAVNGVNVAKEVPSYWALLRGHNGGPAVFQPKGICVMDVS